MYIETSRAKVYKDHLKIKALDELRDCVNVRFTKKLKRVINLVRTRKHGTCKRDF